MDDLSAFGEKVIRAQSKKLDKGRKKKKKLVLSHLQRIVGINASDFTSDVLDVVIFLSVAGGDSSPSVDLSIQAGMAPHRNAHHLPLEYSRFPTQTHPNDFIEMRDRNHFLFHISYTDYQQIWRDEQEENA